MMGRWGLEGMRSFEQTRVAEKEGERLEGTSRSQPSARSAENPASL